MGSSFKQKLESNQRQPSKSNRTESNLENMLALDSSHNEVEQNLDKEVVKKVLHSGRKISQSSQKLKEIMVKLKKDVTFLINFGERNEEIRIEHCVLKRLDLLNTYIDQVTHAKDIVRKGGTTFMESLYIRQKKINDILNKIREDVFHSYLKLDAEEKYTLATRGGQMTCIFTLLGIIERELQIMFEKTSQSIVKKNTLRNKIIEPVTQAFTSSRSLPVLRALKQRSKESQFINFQNNKNEIIDQNSDFFEAENIPNKCPTIESFWGLKQIDTDTPSQNLESSDIVSNVPIISFVHGKKVELEKDDDKTQLSRQISMKNLLGDHDSNQKVEHLEYKATGFEISISNENIQIKIPTNVIYLVRSNNNKNLMKSGDEKSVLESEISHTAMSCSATSSDTTVTNVVNPKVSDSDDSVSSSLYTDIVTDPEVAPESSKWENNQTKQKYKHSNKSKHKRIFNYDKCVPFISENGYHNQPYRDHNQVKSCNDLVNKIVRKEVAQQSVKDSSFLTQWKEGNGKMTCQYASKLSTIGNPLFGNVLQIIDLVKKIHRDCNTNKTMNPNQHSKVVSKTDQLIPPTENTVLKYCNEGPPSITASLPSLESSSIWKESASRLCELCPGCISLAKLADGVS